MTLIYFVLVLGVTILIHELGHFIFAKKAKVHVYEFSIGMGPKIFGFTRKNDETKYSIRLFPIGGYVSMAGEDMTTDEAIPKDRRLNEKKWINRVLVIVAGVIFNFIFAITVLFLIALFNGAPQTKPIIEKPLEDFPIVEVAKPNDEIIKVGNIKVGSIDRLLLELSIHSGEKLEFTVLRDGKKISYTVEPKKITEDNQEYYKYGFTLNNQVDKGLIASIKYAFVKTYNIIEQMAVIIFSLATGNMSTSSLSGPIGIYTAIGDTAKTGIVNVIYLTAMLSINIGFINLLPFPAFDGGRLLFLIIEKIKGSKVNPQLENTVHAIGFFLLMILMIMVTYGDIIKLIK